MILQRTAVCVIVGILWLQPVVARECETPSGKTFSTDWLCEQISPEAIERVAASDDLSAPRPIPPSETYTPRTASPSQSYLTSPEPSAAPASSYSPRSSGGSGYIRGPRGGCYTFSASGKKRYVDRSLCN